MEKTVAKWPTPGHVLVQTPHFKTKECFELLDQSASHLKVMKNDDASNNLCNTKEKKPKGKC